MHDALTLRGQLAALAADLDPRSGSSVRWCVPKYSRGAPAQAAILAGMQAGREYSISEFAPILPGRSHSAVRCVLDKLVDRGLLSCKKVRTRSGHSLMLFIRAAS
jgi:hypothetical protein